ncbi:hypothetical protein B0H13DRAFT_2337802 [Mycena leptocephala]|nr:hypothetical protein B0H13DRAFT_2337802 [Mycena leptocephala]
MLTRLYFPCACNTTFIAWAHPSSPSSRLAACVPFVASYPFHGELVAYSATHRLASSSISISDSFGSSSPSRLLVTLAVGHRPL